MNMTLKEKMTDNAMVSPKLFIAGFHLLLDKSPYIVCVAYTVLLLQNRASDILWVIFGQWGCNHFSSRLKDWIKEPRPPSSSHRDGYGMPSAHSASLAYTATAWTLLLERNTAGFSQSRFKQTCLLIGLHICALIVAYSRLFLGRHTVRQVVVGYIGGTIFAWIWLTIRTSVIGPALHTT